MYEIDSLSLEESFIQDRYKSFTDILNNTYKLETKYKDIINEFYKVRLTSPEKVTYVDTHPEYMESSGNYRYRFFIIKVENDYVFTNFKVVDPHGQERYFHIYNPISLHGNIKNEERVLRELSEIPCIRKVVEVNTKGDFTEWCNNYYNTKETCSFMFKSKWKSKHCIKKLDEFVSTEFIKYSDDVFLEEIMRAFDGWLSFKSFKEERRQVKKLVQMFNRNPDVQMCVMRVNNKIVAFNIMFVYLNKYAIVHIAKYLSVADEKYIQENFNVSSDVAKLLKYNLSAYFQYKTHEEYLYNTNHEAFYYEGDTHKIWLRSYKRMFYRKNLFYKKVPIHEYISKHYPEEGK